MFVISFRHCDNSSSTHVHVLGFFKVRHFDDASIVGLMHFIKRTWKVSAGDHRKMRLSLASLSASCTATIAAALMCM